MEFSVKQILMLNELMYLEAKPGRPFPDILGFVGKKVGDLVNIIDIDAITDPDPEHLPMITAADWKNVLQAIKQDNTVMRMVIAEAWSGQETGAEVSGLFLTPDRKDAVFVFRGTMTAGEWEDNFAGADVADTPHQVNALKAYRQLYDRFHLKRTRVIVSGHSKGGNKAKYITILDETPCRCISFNGQGFSELFFEKYGPLISEREKKIENHIVDYDYVNFLLNDIGSTAYYCGYDYGVYGVAESHWLSTFMRFEDDGDFEMERSESGQAPEMKMFDHLINSYLRSLDMKARVSAMKTISAVAENILSLQGIVSAGAAAAAFLGLLTDEVRSRDLSYLLAYVIRYERAFPDAVSQVEGMLKRFGTDGLAKLVNEVAGMLNWKRTFFGVKLSFETLFSMIGRMDTKMPDWVYDKGISFLNNKGLEISREQIHDVLRFVDNVDRNLATLKVLTDEKERPVTENVQIRMPVKSGAGSFLKALGEDFRLIHSYVESIGT
ncbi:MAG: DUF2974 domain-containing protein [Solobacterium sp.]|nr:DUF2974 domain-containing protein [Solobacterium sp.]